jgi:hypothetical protein
MDEFRCASRVFVLISLLLVLFPGTAPAAPTIINSESAFLTAAGTVSQESFENLTATNTFSFNQSFTLTDFTFALGTPSGSGGGVRNLPYFGTHATDGDQFIINSTAGGGTFPVLLTFNAPITAFGINITDFGDDPREAASTLIFTTDTGVTGNTGLLLLGDANEQFFGLIDTNPFTSIRIERNPADGELNIGYDEVYYNTATAVPEPASLLLIGSGFVGLAATAWTRRRVK